MTIKSSKSKSGIQQVRRVSDPSLDPISEGRHSSYFQLKGFGDLWGVEVGLLIDRAIGALIVFDLTNEESFKNVENWLQEVEENTSSSIVKILIGNKSDIKDK